MAVDDVNVKSTRKACFEYLQGLLLVFLIASKFQKLLKGGNIYINVAILYMKFLDLFICFDSFSNVHIDVREGFLKLSP